MGDPKTKDASNLRTPKPKKTLGLSVPPALRLPHEDLIKQTPTLPSQTSQGSQTRHSTDQDQTKSFPVAPERDFTKVANSIHRQAIPEGVFTGKSKQLYDCLYAMTRGAIAPTRSIRISRPNLMKRAAIGARVTFETNVEKLVQVGLLEVNTIPGEHKGNEYVVFLPGEKSMPSLTSQTRHAQKLDRLVRLETSQTRHSLNDANKEGYAIPKTSFKTNTIDDDESSALRAFNDIIREAVKAITGGEIRIAETEKWSEVAQILMAEFKTAAERSPSITSAPAFLAEHLRRRFNQSSKKSQSSPGNITNALNQTSAGESPAPPSPPRKLTVEEKAEAVQMVIDLVLSGNYTLEQAETQFAPSFGDEHWEKIRTTIIDSLSKERAVSEAQGRSEGFDTT